MIHQRKVEKTHLRAVQRLLPKLHVPSRQPPWVRKSFYSSEIFDPEQIPWIKFHNKGVIFYWDGKKTLHPILCIWQVLGQVDLGFGYLD